MSKCDIIYRKSPPISHPDCKYPGFAPGTTLLKAGTVYEEGYMPLSCDIVFERDVAVTMRDGTTLYADIYRPVGDEKVPAILNSTTFSKGPIGVPRRPGMPDDEQVPGVKKNTVSGYNSFESTDPGFFVPNGYAVVNLDIRGCYMSDGKNPYFGSQEAEDDYDTIEWLAVQDWCNGAVTMTGNSWLGINQWFAGATRPPHLACLAPWEGWHDMYRDEYMVGGIANYPGFRFNNAYKDGGELEDVVANCQAHPLFDEYWEDKAAKVELIEVPVYATASWTSPVHCQGTIMAWRKLQTNKKWIRIHNTQEWFDTYKPETSADMLKFFDYYMKGIDNGWEETPMVRMSVLDPGGEDIVERVEPDFPLPHQENKELFLDPANDALVETALVDETTKTYSGCQNKEMVTFTYTFDQEAEIAGYINVKLWMESEGYNEIDLFVRMEKLGADGEPVYHYFYEDKRPSGVYSGPSSRQRTSLRKLDPEKSTANEPYHTFDETQKLKVHEVVPVEIGLFPTALRFHAGESIQLQIAGYDFYDLPGHGSIMNVGIDNNGNHIIHAGGQYDSKVTIPFIPVK